MVYIRLIYVYSVISVNEKRLPDNTKKWTLVRSWLIRVRLFILGRILLDMDLHCVSVCVFLFSLHKPLGS